VNFHQETLPNGVTVLAECSEHAVSTALGFFVRTGARDEAPQLAGVSHFLEHMAFKGTEERTGDDINRMFDEIGAKYNAYTTEEHTVYHAVVLPEYVAQTIDLLGDLLRPTLRDDDFGMEKKVILEEIGMYADSPTWTAYERAMRLHFTDHPLGNSVLGTKETVGALSPTDMRSYLDANYSPDNVIVAATGKVDWPRFRDLISTKCGGWTPRTRPRQVPRSYKSASGELIVADRFVQECALLMAPAPAADSPLRAAADVLASILGDDTGSRFHWALAEPGKVDSIEFGFHEYEGVGAFMLTATCNPELVEENLSTVRKILNEVVQNGVTAQEVDQARNKIAARTVLAAERPRNRLGPLGYNWSYRREYRTVDAELGELKAITPKQVQAVLAEFPPTPTTTVCLGPLKKVTGLDS
jgi:predicted Zn-dependent peptidase